MTVLSFAQHKRASTALELVAATTGGNTPEVDAILADIDAADLIQGLIVLVSSLRSSLAVAWGCSLADLDDQIAVKFSADRP